MHKLSLSLAFGGVFGIGFCLSSFSFADGDSAFLRGLVDRNLFESVELFCDTEFAKELTPETKFLFAAELVRSRTKQIVLAEPERRDRLRQGMAQLELQLDRPGIPVDTDTSLARLAFHLQLALADYSLGDWLRLEAEVAPAGPPGVGREEKMKPARNALYDSLEKFKKCNEEASVLGAKISGQAEQASKVQALYWSIRSQWSLAQVSLALSFPPGDDRTFCLNQAVEILTELAGLGIVDPVVFRSRIELVRCYRLLGENERCLDQIAILKAANLSGELLYLAQAEHIRYLLANHAVEEALRDFSQEPLSPQATRCPDYVLARLELMLAEISIGNNKPDLSQQERLAKILETVKYIQQDFGPLWGRRARMLLSASPLSDTQSANLELIKALADDLFQNGQFSEAVRLYDRASLMAEAAGDMEPAFRCAATSAGVLYAVLEKIKNEEADAAPARRHLIEALRKLTARFPDMPESQEYHLKAVDLAAESVQKHQAEPDKYVDILKEHADRWPDSPKVPPALLQAALLAERQGNIEDALAILKRIPNHSTVGLEAVQAAERCFETLYVVQTPSLDMMERREAEWMRQRLADAKENSWNVADAAAALRAAECLLNLAGRTKNETNASEPLHITETLLRDAERSSVLSPSQRASASALLVRALTNQGRLAEAAAILTQFDADKLETLSDTEKLAFQLVHAKLLADTGKTQQAVDLLAGMLKQAPDDLSVLETLAEILSKQDDPKALGRALQFWTRIADRAKQKTERWWTARQRILEIHRRLGQHENARQQFELLKLLHPDLGGPARKATLEALFDEQK